MRGPRILIPVAAVLAAVAVPVATLAASPPAESPPPTTDDPLVAAARAGYDEFLAMYDEFKFGELSEFGLAGCPWMSPAQLVSAVAPVGDAKQLQPEVRAYLEVDDVGDDESVVTIRCDTSDYTESGAAVEGPVYGVGIAVLDVTAYPGAVDELRGIVESADESLITEPSAVTFGGTLYGYCEEQDLPADSFGCFQYWTDESLAVGLAVVVPRDGAGEALGRLGDVVLAELPSILQRLADGLKYIETTSRDSDDVDETVVGTVTVP